VYGGAGDFPALLEVMTSRDLPRQASPVTRLLFGARWLPGRWSGWDDGAERPIPGRPEASLAERLPDDPRGTAAGLRLGSSFSPLYRTGTEFAAELPNQTVHGVMHLAWVDRGHDRYQEQMAVYVKPRGRLGKQYMAFIAPFRHWVIYPAVLRQIERAWQARGPWVGRWGPAGGRGGEDEGGLKSMIDV
jgi:hypothetical protein